jgi:predicted RNase H-like HicB family nuclease
MALLTDYLAAALKSAVYKLGEGGFVEGTVPEIPGLLVRGRTFEECRERLRGELETWLARALLSHQMLPELGGAGALLQELALSTHPSTNPVEQAILQNTRTILQELRSLRRGGRPEGQPSALAPQAQPQAQTQPKRSGLKVADYLAEVGLQLKPSLPPSNDAEEKALERLAGFMGERYSAFEGLYARLKSAAARGGADFQYSLSALSQQDIGTNTQICLWMKEAGLLEKYTYSSKQRRIYARPSKEGKHQGFLTGGWFERYVRQRAQLSLRRRNIAHDLEANPLILYPNGDRFEVDLLVRTPNRFVLVECKTGEFDEALDRHQRIASDLRIPAKQVLYVLLGIPEPVLDELSGQWGFTFANEKTIDEQLEALLV